MKMRHKRLVKRIVAGIFALLMAYVGSFGSWVVFPFAIGLVLVQYFSWRFETTHFDTIASRLPALDCSVIVVIILSAIATFLSNAIVSLLFLAFGIAGAVLSHMLTKVETNTKKRRKRNFVLWIQMMGAYEKIISAHFDKFAFFFKIWYNLLVFLIHVPQKPINISEGNLRTKWRR